MKESLVQIGLTAAQAEVYLALRKLGKTKVGPIVEATGHHRTIVYRALAALEERRLVTRVQRGSVSYYAATDPEHLLDEIYAKERTAKEVVEELKRNAVLEDQEIVVYEGVDGVRTSLVELARLLKKGEEYFVLGSGGERAQEVVGKAHMKQYLDALERHKVKMRLLMYQSRELSPDVREWMRARLDFEEKVVPYETLETVTVIFTKEYVWMYIYEEPYTVIRIHNPVLVTSYRAYFALLWEQGAYIQRGHEALEAAHWQMLNEVGDGGAYMVLGGSIDPKDRRSIAFFKMFHDRRVARGITMKMVSYKESIVYRNDLASKGDIDLELSQVRPFPKAPRSPMQVNLYAGKVLMMFHGKEPVVMQFDQPEMYEGFRTYFEELWDQEAVVYRGEMGVAELVAAVLEEGGILHVIAANGGLAEHEKAYKKLVQAAKDKRIEVRMLVSKAYRNEAFVRIPNARVRYVAREAEPPLATWVFGDYVASIRWGSPETVLILRDPEAAEQYRTYYKRLERKASI